MAQRFWIGSSVVIIIIFSEYTWEDDDWALAFRLTSNIQQRAYSTYMDKLRNDDTSYARAYLQPACQLYAYADTTGTRLCDTHYRSGLLNDWDDLNINQVKIVFLKSISALVA